MLYLNSKNTDNYFCLIVNKCFVKTGTHSPFHSSWPLKMAVNRIHSSNKMCYAAGRRCILCTRKVDLRGTLMALPIFPVSSSSLELRTSSKMPLLSFTIRSTSLDEKSFGVTEK